MSGSVSSSGSRPSFPGGPGSSDSQTESSLSGALARAEAEVRDALERLRMARSDAGGENLALDSVEIAIEGEGATAEDVRENRASRIAESVAQSLEATADRLRDAAR